jgi:ammonia channel protein AmtB
MIGTIFLWMYWPSFNGALASIEAAAQHEPNPANVLLPQQYYCVVNTLFSLLGSVLSTFAVSSWLNNGRFDMMHVQVRGPLVAQGWCICLLGCVWGGWGFVAVMVVGRP